ncbi:MAG: hypothetical protein RR893_14180, partial [Clostridia bacterium]
SAKFSEKVASDITGPPSIYRCYSTTNPMNNQTARKNPARFAPVLRLFCKGRPEICRLCNHVSYKIPINSIE